MNELTEDDIEVREEGDRGVYIFRQDCEMQEIKDLILQNQKLREMAEEEFHHYDITFKKHKDIDDFKVAQVLQKILRRSNENNK